MLTPKLTCYISRILELIKHFTENGENKDKNMLYTKKIIIIITTYL